MQNSPQKTRNTRKAAVPRVIGRRVTGKAQAGASASRRSYGGVASLQRAAARRVRLLSAALELFASQGYARTPIEQLCAAAKVTARHFYELFESREALLAALYADIAAALRQAMQTALACPAANLEQKVEATVRAMLGHYLADHRIARIGVLEVVGVSAAMEQRRRAVIHEIAQLLESYLAQLVQRGELPARRYHLMSVAMVGGINELLAEWLTVSQPPSLHELTNEVELLFRTLLLGLAVTGRSS